MLPFLQKWTPDAKRIRKFVFLKIKKTRYFLKELSLLNCHTVAGGVAIGLFVNFLPLPFQALWASLLCFYFKTNLLVAVMLTWINNPFTFLPINYFLYRVGLFVLNEPPQDLIFPEIKFEPSHFMVFFNQFLGWILTLGKPYILGVFLVSLSTAIFGYLLTIMLWEISCALKKYKK